LFISLICIFSFISVNKTKNKFKRTIL